jgi:agmatinase
MTTQFLPWFAGRQTFLRAPSVGFEQIKRGMTVVSGAPHSMRGRLGERDGPRAIREASVMLADRLWRGPSGGVIDVSSGRRLFRPAEPRVVDVGDFNVYPSDVMKTTEGVAGGVAEVVRRGGFSACLGGDRLVGYASCLGYADAFRESSPHGRLGYIHIDGHLDFADWEEAYGKYHHGTTARRISELGPISPSNMVFIGIQGPCYLVQVQEIRRLGGTIFTSQDIRVIGPVEVGRRAGEVAMKGCDSLYLSCDIDVIDAGFLDGTGSVTMGAIAPISLFKILDALAPYPIGSMNLVETAPPLDPSGRSALIAAQALITLLVTRLFEIG